MEYFHLPNYVSISNYKSLGLTLRISMDFYTTGILVNIGYENEISEGTFCFSSEDTKSDIECLHLLSRAIGV